MAIAAGKCVFLAFNVPCVFGQIAPWTPVRGAYSASLAVFEGQFCSRKRRRGGNGRGMEGRGPIEKWSCESRTLKG